MSKEADRQKKWIWTMSVVLYVGFIFHNSMTPAIESSRQSGQVLIMVLEAVESMGLDSGWITEYFVRKMAHFGEYALLGLGLSMTLRLYALSAGVRRSVHAWLGLMIPFADETIQLCVEGRSGQISDVWLDMAGIFAGSLAVMTGLWLRQTRRQGRE